MKARKMKTGVGAKYVGKKAKTEKESDREEVGGGAVFLTQSITAGEYMNGAMKIDFQVNYSGLSAFYKTITFTKVPPSPVGWVHFISLPIFFLSPSYSH